MVQGFFSVSRISGFQGFGVECAEVHPDHSGPHAGQSRKPGAATFIKFCKVSGHPGASCTASFDSRLRVALCSDQMASFLGGGGGFGGLYETARVTSAALALRSPAS